MKRLLLLCLVSGCGQLFTAQGNDFPCDYTQAPEVRDAVCAPGEVCGPDDRCRRFQYEGPQFEGKAVLPDSRAAKRVHPIALVEPVHHVLAQERTPLLSTRTGGPAVAISASGRATFIGEGELSPVGTIEGYQKLAVPGFGEGQALLTGLVGVVDGGVEQVSPRAPVVFGTGWGGATENRAVVGATGLRSGLGAVVVLRGGMLAQPGSGVLRGADPRLQPLETPTGLAVPLADGGFASRVVDALVVPAPLLRVAPAGSVLVAVTAHGFAVRSLVSDAGFDEGFHPLHEAPVEIEGLALGDGPTPVTKLVRSASGRTWVLARGGQVSTWVLTSGASPTMTRAFSDCVVCGGGDLVGLAAVETPQPAVEVLCATRRENRERPDLRVERVVGAAVTSGLACLTEEVTPTFDLARLAIARLQNGRPAIAQDESTGVGVALGGVSGQLWVGDGFSSARPLFLERVPLAGGALESRDGGVLPVALTDQFLSAPLSDTNGWAVQRLGAGQPPPADLRPRAIVGGVPGWMVSSGADLVKVAFRNDSRLELQLGFGPRLVDARGEPVRTSQLFAEGLEEFDGGVRAFVVTADDSLYLVPNDFTPAEVPRVLPPVTPVLSPEPASPIRSFALERTPVFTNGVDRVRGYAVTSRNLFELVLSGTPARWDARPLQLAPGDPLEVWMDHPRGGLGRVGYRQGSVYTLPGGFELVRPDDAGQPAEVLDYENLGGWPVAWSTTGAWAAFWDLRADGKLDNKLDSGVLGKPMVWRKLTLPDGGEPWLEVVDGGVRAPPGRLLVVAAPTRFENAKSNDAFLLLLFTPGEVYELATMSRAGSIVTQEPTKAP